MDETGDQGRKKTLLGNLLAVFKKSRRNYDCIYFYGGHYSPLGADGG